MMQDLSEGPLPVVKDLLEKDIQSACIRWAREQRAYCRKFSSPGNRSVPDYVVLYRGSVVFFEFKRFGKKPTRKQAEEHRAIRAAGGMVWVVSGVEQFKMFWGRTWG